jgi:ribosomal protein S12 methylthiotransferase accessory factor YcaO
LFSAPSTPGINLRRRRKHRATNGVGVSTRVRAVDETLAEIIPISRKIGITRIADITHLDRLSIPNYSAVLPGTKDSIWVYGGKGITNVHAKVSAIMEAIERYSSLSSTHEKQLIRGSFAELSKSYNNVLHPAEVVETVNQEGYDESSIMDYIFGFDLLDREEVLVPAEIALYMYNPKPPAIRAFSQFHTNGLASGNVLEEAVCHALCEVIERDAVSIAELCASCIPYNILERILESLKIDTGYTFSGYHFEDKFVDDSSIFPIVEISEVAKEFEPIKLLVKKFANSGIPLVIKNVTQEDIGIPTFVASTIEWITNDYGYFAKGFGTHPDAKTALIRAITEASQTRAVNIQGARDDLKKIQYAENDEIYRRKWPFMSIIPQQANKKLDHEAMINFSQILSNSNIDLLDDINLILSRLKKAGLKSVIVVDLTSLNTGIPVVRAIVPGLETFEVTNSVMGQRAREYFSRLHRS